jgi:hypothetical protein
MTKFTYSSHNNKKLAHLDPEDALHLAGKSIPFPRQQLRRLLAGDIDYISLLNGTLTNFIIPEK